MRLKKQQQGDQQRRLPRPGTQFIRPDSGQVEEALRPPFVAKRCRKRGKADDGGI